MTAGDREVTAERDTAAIVAAVEEMHRERRERTAELIAELEADDDDLDDLLESIDAKRAARRDRTTSILEELSGDADG